MDTEQLKTFLEVNRTRHFGRAAQNLFLTQSAVSARIKALEEQIGTSLFVRNRNDIQLTPAGHRLLSHSEGILAAWNRAKHDVAIEGEMEISLSMAGMPSLWDIILQRWLHEMHEKQPSVVIHANVYDAETILHRLLEGTLDLGFTFEAPQVAQIETKQIATIPLIMVSSRPDINSTEAINEDYIVVDWGLSFAISHARHFPEFSPSHIRLPLGRIALDYILACGGSAYLAEPMVKTAIASGKLYRVDDAPVIERPAYALYSRDTKQTELIYQSLELIV